MFVVGCVFLLSISWTGSEAVQIRITPDKLIATTRQSVTISCVSDSQDVDIQEITVMKVYRNDEAAISVLRPCGQISHSTGTSSRFKAVGKIAKDPSADSFLNTTLSDPTSGDTGLYTCVVYYLDQDGMMKDQKATDTMVVENLDVAALEGVLNTLKSKVALLEEKVSETSGNVSRHQDQIKSLDGRTTGLERNANFTIAFSATNDKSDITTKVGNVLILPDILMMQGQGYNGTTGVFTSPRAGVYVFHVVITDSRPKHGIHVDLRKNDVVIARQYAYDYHSWSQSSITAVVSLDIGDNVFSVLRANEAFLRRDRHTVFTGYLLHLL